MRVKIWLQAMRPFSLTASVVPVLVGAAMAFAYADEVAWFLLLPGLVCAMLLHAATNVLNEYFDFKKGVDTGDSFASSRVLVEGLELPARILVLGSCLLAAGVLLGLVLVFLRGMPLFIFAVAGFLGAGLYTGQPFGYKYIGLGDIFVFLFMGPLLVTASFFLLSGAFSLVVLYVSLPVGFLVTAILSSNNFRDIVHDRKAKVMTLENSIGFGASKILYLILVVAAYLSIAVLVARGMLGPLSLVVFLSLPLAVRNVSIVLATGKEKGSRIFFIDVLSAQLHLAFGVLLIVSIMTQKLIR